MSHCDVCPVFLNVLNPCFSSPNSFNTSSTTHSLTQHFKLPKSVQLRITAGSPLIITQSKAVKWENENCVTMEENAETVFFFSFFCARGAMMSLCEALCQLAAVSTVGKT